MYAQGCHVHISVSVDINVMNWTKITKTCLNPVKVRTDESLVFQTPTDCNFTEINPTTEHIMDVFPSTKSDVIDIILWELRLCLVSYEMHVKAAL